MVLGVRVPLSGLNRMKPVTPETLELPPDSQENARFDVQALFEVGNFCEFKNYYVLERCCNICPAGFRAKSTPMRGHCWKGRRVVDMYNGLFYIFALVDMLKGVVMRTIQKSIIETKKKSTLVRKLGQ